MADQDRTVVRAETCQEPAKAALRGEALVNAHGELRGAPSYEQLRGLNGAHEGTRNHRRRHEPESRQGGSQHRGLLAPAGREIAALVGELGRFGNGIGMT